MTVSYYTIIRIVSYIRYYYIVIIIRNLKNTNLNVYFRIYNINLTLIYIKKYYTIYI